VPLFIVNENKPSIEQSCRSICSCTVAGGMLVVIVIPGRVNTVEMPPAFSSFTTTMPPCFSSRLKSVSTFSSVHSDTTTSFMKPDRVTGVHVISVNVKAILT